MTLNKLKYILPLFIAIFSADSYAYIETVILDEKSSLNIDVSNYSQRATYGISHPGIDTWIENGDIHVSKNMPACIIFLGDNSLDADQQEKFVKGLDITTHGKNISLEAYQGTWAFVDKKPFNYSFGDTYYEIEPKNNLTFGQLLRYVGGTPNTKIEFVFSRGCIALAERPFLPAKADVSIKNSR